MGRASRATGVGIGTLLLATSIAGITSNHLGALAERQEVYERLRGVEEVTPQIVRRTKREVADIYSETNTEMLGDVAYIIGALTVGSGMLVYSLLGYRKEEDK